MLLSQRRGRAARAGLARGLGGALLGGALLGALLPAACGARTGLRQGYQPGSDEGGADAAVEADAPVEDVRIDCVTDLDCGVGGLCGGYLCLEGRCILSQPARCDDGDPCTDDRCDDAVGGCVSEPNTRDEDGDTYFGPRPGTVAGAPGSCGDDCDDTSPLAHPGGIEVCDGVDNDCNGIVDDDARFEPDGASSVRVSGASFEQAGQGGLVWNGELYAAAYAGQDAKWSTYVKGLTPTGAAAFPETAITNTSNDTFTGPIVWTGSVFGAAWEDRRAGNYEIYFNRLDPGGRKLGDDLRVTVADSFSLHPHMLWNGSEYLLVWDDQRQGAARIMARRLGPEGELLGEEQFLSDGGSESPFLAIGESTVALVYNVMGTLGTFVVAHVLQPDLTAPSPMAVLSSTGGVTPVVARAGDRFVVAWSTRDTGPGPAIWGAVIGADGQVLVPETRLTTGASFARAPWLLSLGDRLLLLWADDFDGNYEIYSKMIGPDLRDRTPRARVTRDASDSLSPIGAFGPDGDVGVIFRDKRSGSWQVWFNRLECRAGQ